MALISMPVFDTEKNNRSWMTRKTLLSLSKTVDWSKHRLMVCDNSSCRETQGLFDEAKAWLPFELISLPSNIGTAKATNKGWERRSSGENCCKLDNDVEFAQPGWLDILDLCIAKDPAIGIAGCKRKDLLDWPDHPWGHPNQTRLKALPHDRTKGDKHNGDPWMIVEVVKGMLFGTCQLYSSALLDKIGYLCQPGEYAWDDSISSVRARKAGFYCCYLPSIDIIHLDPGGDAYCQHKVELADKYAEAAAKMCAEFKSGARPLFCGPDDA